jgi:hypothetical protein
LSPSPVVVFERLLVKSPEKALNMLRLKLAYPS